MMYPFLNRIYRLYSVPQRRKRLHTYGYEALDVLFDIAQREDIDLFLTYGTLLGAIREKDFIPHDDDIDLGVLPYEGRDGRQLAQLLVEKYDMKFCHAFSYRGEVTEVSMEYKGIPVDLFFYYTVGDKTWCYEYLWQQDAPYTDVRQNNVRMVSQAMVNRLAPITMQGHQCLVPEHAEAFVESIFGSNWKTPDPSFTADDQPGNIDLDEYGYILTYDELMNQTFWKN